MFISEMIAIKLINQREYEFENANYDVGHTSPMASIDKTDVGTPSNPRPL